MQWSPAMVGLIPVVVVVVAFLLNHYFRRWRKERILNKAFPANWTQILNERITVYSVLPKPQRHKLEQLIHLFLDDKTFYGCAGLVITDVMKVCIAAEACLLLLGQSGPVYPKLQSILVYPSAFRA